MAKAVDLLSITVTVDPSTGNAVAAYQRNIIADGDLKKGGKPEAIDSPNFTQSVNDFCSGILDAVKTAEGIS